MSHAGPSYPPAGQTPWPPPPGGAFTSAPASGELGPGDLGPGPGHSSAAPPAWAGTADRAPSSRAPRWSIGRTALTGILALGLAVGAAVAVNASSLGSEEQGGTGMRGNAAQFMRSNGTGSTTGVGGTAGSLHGEFVTSKATGSYVTIRTQSGKVTAVDSGSITVESLDGFSATYVINDSTAVGDGLATINVGGTVEVTATAPSDTSSGGMATATSIAEGSVDQQGQGQQLGGSAGPGA